MASEFVIFCHDIEEEWFDIVVKSFGTKEELREKTQVLAVYWVLSAIHFKEGVFAVAIHFIAWRVLGWAFKLRKS